MKAECEFCGEKKVLNRYFLCNKCWKAQDHQPIFNVDTNDHRLDKVFSATASHTLKDIIPYAEKGMDNESIEETKNFYSGLRNWK